MVFGEKCCRQAKMDLLYVCVEETLNSMYISVCGFIVAL